MNLTSSHSVEIPEALLDAIRQVPVVREVEHCGARFAVDPFDFYATCPKCRTRIKLRSFSAAAELEDLFDAVFAWMNRSGAEDVAARRRRALADESDD